MASAREEYRISSYRKLLIELSIELSAKDVEGLKFAAGDFLPSGIIEKTGSGLQLIYALQRDDKIGPSDMTLLQNMFEIIGRVDLSRRVQYFSTATGVSKPDGMLVNLVSNEGRNGNDHAAKERDPVNTLDTGGNKADGLDDMVTDGAENDDDKGTAQSDPVNTIDTAEGQQTGPSQNAPSSRFQHDPAMEPEPARCVNFLLYKGYSVEILGGKHFKTRDGEIVEMKSGTQYKILVKNSHTYGCYLDISIDGFDVGRWALHGGEEMSIERSTYEAKKFTFYRVKTAPKEAGIESGRAENGLVKCAFTPEAFLNIPVTISGFSQSLNVTTSQSLNVSMAPCATIGDLKHEVQSQMKIQNDPDQVLAQDDKVLSNAALLKRVLRTPGNLRLIDAEMTITVTVEVSSSVSSPKTFPVIVHPGKAKVHDLMEQIERELDVPVSDQKLYFGRTLLSGAPRRCLPDKLICSSRPAVAVTVPKYLRITVEEPNGNSHSIKIDKEKNLRAVFEEIPPRRNLKENAQVMFHFNKKKLYPFKDGRTLSRLGICSGSKLELVIKILFIEVEACFSDGSPSVRVRCNPQDTFQDLVKKIGLKDKRGKWRFTFAMDTRSFDPDQDKNPLQDYGITHGCTLDVTRHRATDDATVPHETVHSSQLEYVGWLSDVPGERKVQEKKSFFCSVKEKLFKKPLEVRRRKETAGHLLRRSASHKMNPPSDMVEALRLPVYGVYKDLPNEEESCIDELYEGDPAWRSGATTLQGFSTQDLPELLTWEHLDKLGSASPPISRRGTFSIGSGEVPPLGAIRRTRNACGKKSGRLKSMPPSIPKRKSGSTGSHGVPLPRAFRPSRIEAHVCLEEIKCSRIEKGYEGDPAWRSGATTLQGQSTQNFTKRSLSNACGKKSGRLKSMPPSISKRKSGSTGSHGLPRLGVSLGEPPPGAIRPSKNEESCAANVVVESDPEWRSGGTTFQGDSTQRFITAEAIKVDPSRKVELILRLVAREGEKGLKFPEGKCTPLSTLIPPAVRE